MKTLVITIAGCLALCASTFAQMPFVLFEHTGGNDPTTEGFTQQGTLTGSAAGNSWKINDNSTTERLNYIYGGSAPVNDLMTLAQRTFMQTPGNGWYATFNVNVLSAPSVFSTTERPVYATWSVNNGTGNRRYNLRLGLNGSGNTEVDWDPMFDGINATLTGGAHVFQFRNSGGVDATDIYADGAYLATVTGNSDVEPFRFGSVADAGMGEANWALAQFYVNPEPTTTVLALLAAGVLARMRRYV